MRPLLTFVVAPAIFTAGAVLIGRASRKAPPTPAQPIYPIDLVNGREIYDYEDET